MTQEDIIRMARESGMAEILDQHAHEYGGNALGDIDYTALKKFATLVRADEREECAKVADKYANGLERNYSEIIADLIRARGNA